MGNHYEKLILREVCVQVNIPFHIRQVRLPIQRVLTPIRGVLNLIRQVVPLISDIRLYSPYHSHLHPSSPFPIQDCTIIAEHLVKSSHSITPCNDHELTPSTAYPKYSLSWEYSISRVLQHPPKIVCHPFMITITR